ncbi:MAG: glycosyltransferase family 2 protein [Polaromonas sp.]|uniref:glycosyltransferase family 2 protein n=1 Tax=Polaromonas sp. TaxID=1869339 RepID=UPI0025DD4D81|nr:glycosyltransferase family A protein [Polaromonas sp.]MBI2725908.1 glycosyltransferase family 2 protein [Polaromonas sp.]
MSQQLGKMLALVTVGIPVRNGGEFLAHALDSILGQSYRNLEIVVSDNGSDDQTAETMARYCKLDRRIVYIRQREPIKAFDNFRFVLDQAKGVYFLWAAHDDFHSPDYIERLVHALEADSEAVLTFGDLLITSPGNEQGTLRDYDFATEELQWRRRMKKAAFTQCFHIYGVWRTSSLKSIPFAGNAWWPDLPVMIGAAFIGTFKYVPGPRFFYHEVPKTNLQRVQYQDYAARFNIVAGVLGLIRASYISSAGVGGLFAGLYGAWLVISKQARNLPGFLGRRLRWP